MNIQLICVDQQHVVTNIEHASLETCSHHLSEHGYIWVHVQGKPDADTLQALGKMMSLHHVALSDVVSVGERSKAEHYASHWLVILNTLTRSKQQLVNEQVAVFLGKNFLLSVHMGAKDPFRGIRRRIIANASVHPIDYWFYRLVSVLVDRNFPILDAFEKTLHALEQQLLGPDGIHAFRALYTVRRELLFLLLRLKPQTETIHTLMRHKSHFITEDTKLYLRDCYDHAMRLNDIVDIYLSMATHMIEIHLSLVNQKSYVSSELQRKITAYTLVLSQLTFVTGLYGMNVSHIPDWGFNVIASGMIGLGMLTLWWMRKYKFL
jgi:magnesium transporter